MGNDPLKSEYPASQMKGNVVSPASQMKDTVTETPATSKDDGWRLMQHLWQTYDHSSLGKGLLFLYLFSGPHVAGSLNEALGSFGSGVDCWDIAIDPVAHDLCDDMVWSQILEMVLLGEYHGVPKF